ncbi:hypothetical protein [Aurantiacibacter sp. MUD61]|nr:hypothetical protein [Aurantiacibacter sp. MUD61]
MRRIFRSGRRDAWNEPMSNERLNRPTISRGKILPMEEPSWLDRMLGRY